MTQASRAEGIPFAFDKIERTPNILDAHRLIWLAEQNSVQDAVIEAVFRAYFTQGQDITNIPTLLNVVSEAGLDRSRADALLNGEAEMSDTQPVRGQEMSDTQPLYGLPLSRGVVSLRRFQDIFFRSLQRFRFRISLPSYQRTSTAE